MSIFKQSRWNHENSLLFGKLQGNSSTVCYSNVTIKDHQSNVDDGVLLCSGACKMLSVLSFHVRCFMAIDHLFRFDEMLHDLSSFDDK